MSNLFSITGEKCNNSGGVTPGNSGQTYQFDYGLRFNNVRNTIFLRCDGGLGSFSNVAPDVLPTDCSLQKMVVSATISDFDEFTAEVYSNGVFSFSLTKPAGNQNAIQTSAMPLYLSGDQISIRITNISPAIDQPKVSLYFVETIV